MTSGTGVVAILVVFWLLMSVTCEGLAQAESHWVSSLKRVSAPAPEYFGRRFSITKSFVAS